MKRTKTVLYKGAFNNTYRIDGLTTKCLTAIPEVITKAEEY